MKYWRTFLLALQTQMQYRASLIMWLVVCAIGPLTMVMVWFAILGDRGDVGGYGRGDFVLYYVLFTVGWWIVGGSFCHPLANAIRNGEINKTLLQPYNIVWGAAVREQAWKLVSLIMALPFMALLLYVMREYFVWKMHVDQIGYLLLMMVCSAIIFALLQAIIGALAFWVTEIWPFSDMFEVVLYLFGGTLAPMSLLPAAVQQLSEFLPFRYIFYEPVTMLLGQQNNPLDTIFKQSIFILLLYVVYKIMWKAGIRKYEGTGG